MVTFFVAFCQVLFARMVLLTYPSKETDCDSHELCTVLGRQCPAGLHCIDVLCVARLVGGPWLPRLCFLLPFDKFCLIENLFAPHYTDFLGNKGAGLKKETRNAEEP